MRPRRRIPETSFPKAADVNALPSVDTPIGAISPVSRTGEWRIGAACALRSQFDTACFCSFSPPCVPYVLIVATGLGATKVRTSLARSFVIIVMEQRHSSLVGTLASAEALAPLSGPNSLTAEAETD